MADIRTLIGEEAIDLWKQDRKDWIEWREKLIEYA